MNLQLPLFGKVNCASVQECTEAGSNLLSKGDAPVSRQI
jgi:hypothetical protein